MQLDLKKMFSLATLSFISLFSKTQGSQNSLSLPTKEEESEEFNFFSST